MRNQMNCIIGVFWSNGRTASNAFNYVTKRGVRIHQKARVGTSNKQIRTAMDGAHSASRGRVAREEDIRIECMSQRIQIVYFGTYDTRDGTHRRKE